MSTGFWRYRSDCTHGAHACRRQEAAQGQDGAHNCHAHAASDPVIDSVAPVIEYVAPVAAYAAPTPGIEHVSPAPAGTRAAPAPVTEYASTSPAAAHEALVPVAGPEVPVIVYVPLAAAYAAPTPVTDSVTPGIESMSPAATDAAPGSVIDSVAAHVSVIGGRRKLKTTLDGEKTGRNDLLDETKKAGVSKRCCVEVVSLLPDCIMSDIVLSLRTMENDVRVLGFLPGCRWCHEVVRNVCTSYPAVLLSQMCPHPSCKVSEI